MEYKLLLSKTCFPETNWCMSQLPSKHHNELAFDIRLILELFPSHYRKSNLRLSQEQKVYGIFTETLRQTRNHFFVKGM